MNIFQGQIKLYQIEISKLGSVLSCCQISITRSWNILSGSFVKCLSIRVLKKYQNIPTNNMRIFPPKILNIRIAWIYSGRSYWRDGISALQHQVIIIDIIIITIIVIGIITISTILITIIIIS